MPEPANGTNGHGCAADGTMHGENATNTRGLSPANDAVA